MSVRVTDIESCVVNVRTRLPFRYGITTLTVVPHLVVQVDISLDGQRARGLAADNLPPKWFTKDPTTSFEDELADMIRVIEYAGDLALAAGEAETVFALWQRIHAGQMAWGAAQRYAPLLTGFGVSLIERALIDASCRASGMAFPEAIRRNAFGIRLDAIHPELAGFEPGDILPRQPLTSIAARHTVGLGDPITDDEISPAERVEDGLPQSLASVIDAYGISTFKIKLAGDPAVDRERLRQIAQLFERKTSAYAFTLDGNENYREFGAFRSLWEALVGDPRLDGFLRSLLFVEQPLHRDVALADETGAALAEWRDRPPLVIDESDGELDAVRRALDLGYAGASHKNCKGVFKGVANACLIAARNRHSGTNLIQSAEDLTNLGPVALLQDLAVIATLGIPHAERNGHHYFLGLQHIPAVMQRAVLDHHADLYHRAPNGLATLAIRDGRISTRSVAAAPFGLTPDLDLAAFTPLADWNPASLATTP